MINITTFNHCYGCGVCASVCPKHIISMRENDEGFYEPVIQDADCCTGCGLCLKVCAYNHSEVAQDSSNDIQGYAAWSNDDNTRSLCSSGGVALEIGKHLHRKGYEACVVRYDTGRGRAVHYIADTEESLAFSIGSKYIPSFTVDGLSKIDMNGKTLVVGSPCQIDSFRRYIRQRGKDKNFVLVDFFCHGVPSLLLWDKYIKEVERTTGEIEFVSWRNKLAGWHDSWNMLAHGKKQPLGTKDLKPIDWHESYALQVREKKHLYFSQMSHGDLFYKFFLHNCCLNRCCYDCKYKACASAADIRIGDLWGSKYAADAKGVSGVLALTKTGAALIDELRRSCSVVPEEIAVVTAGQMKRPPRRPWMRKHILAAMKSSMLLSEIDSTLLRLYILSTMPERVWRRLCRGIHKTKMK